MGGTLLYILMGRDEFSLRESLEELKRGIGDQDLLSVNTTVLDGQQVTLTQLRTICETVPFLGEGRLVIVKGLLERFEPKSKSGGQKTTRITNQGGEYKVLSTYITQLPDSTILVLIEGEIVGSNPLLRELSGKAKVKSFPLLRDSQLRQWVQQRVKAEGGSISPQAVNLLTRLVGSNLWIMANEINKLVLFTSGRRIEEEDVRVTVSYAQEASVFAMVDAILEFRAGVAEQFLQQLLREGAAPAYLLVMLSRQVRMIVRAKELSSQGQSKMEIQKRIGLTSEFALRKVLEQAGRYPLVRLKEVYHKLLETDLSIKTGKYDGDLALNILIAELCQGGRPPRVISSFSPPHF
ncbi:DNA polymerase III subunit delta, partial [Chloroflexota bacterium]